MGESLKSESRRVVSRGDGGRECKQQDGWMIRMFVWKQLDMDLDEDSQFINLE